MYVFMVPSNEVRNDEACERTYSLASNSYRSTIDLKSFESTGSNDAQGSTLLSSKQAVAGRDTAWDYQFRLWHMRDAAEH